MPLSSWWESRKVARSTAFRIVKLLRIQTGTMKVATSRKPVAALNARQVAQLDVLADRLRNGATLPELEAELETALVAAAGSARSVIDWPTAIWASRSRQLQAKRNDCEPQDPSPNRSASLDFLLQFGRI